jgi:tetratricopeptide (TPR) repeat protein
VPGIVENPTIRNLGTMGSVLTASGPKGSAVCGRPVVNLSLALNYAVGGLDVRGYHVLNLAIHLLAGRAHVVACLMLVFALGWLTVQRNTVHRSAWSFWNDTAFKLPNDDRAHLNLGCLAADQNRIPEAIAEYKTALRINPAFAEAHHDMAVALAGIPGRRSEAIAHLEAALQMRPDCAQARRKLDELQSLP